MRYSHKAHPHNKKDAKGKLVKSRFKDTAHIEQLWSQLKVRIIRTYNQRPGHSQAKNYLWEAVWKLERSYSMQNTPKDDKPKKLKELTFAKYSAAYKQDWDEEQKHDLNAEDGSEIDDSSSEDNGKAAAGSS